MNDYRVNFTRENGTTGSDVFRAATEAEARKDFNVVYRHGNGHITSIELVSTNAPATKEQERKALEKIRKIVIELGTDSYIGTAFDGCFEIAEINIENDFADSWKGRAECATERENHWQSQYQAECNHTKSLGQEVATLKMRLDAELEWKPTEACGTQMGQNDYERLNDLGRILSEEEAKELINGEFGFAVDRITIVNEASTYEVNKHGGTRVKDTYVRKPVYDASDWNYIRFDCAGRSYEMVNGELENYYC